MDKWDVAMRLKHLSFPTDNDTLLYETRNKTRSWRKTNLISFFHFLPSHPISFSFYSNLKLRTKNTECIRDFEWTLLKEVRWLLTTFNVKNIFFEATGSVSKIVLSLKSNLFKSLDTHGSEKKIFFRIFPTRQKKDRSTPFFNVKHCSRFCFCF